MKRERDHKERENRKPAAKTQSPPVYQSLPCTRVKGTLIEYGTLDVAEELPAAIFINGRHATTVTTSPVNLEDLVTGYLFTEELIKTTREIESIKIEKNRISIITKNLFKVLPQKKTILSGCGGSTSYIDVEKLPAIHSDFSVNAAAVTAAVLSVLDSDIQLATKGFTTVALIDDSQQVISVAEDIEDNNAVDRIIGSALRNGVFLSQTFLLSSGRISSETVRKCLTANIPIIVSRNATTTLSIDIADKTGMTLIGFTKDGGLAIFSHPERITQAS
jgi:FdhD protein